LSLLALSVPGLLSQNPLTHAKRENDAKYAFEVRKPFLSRNGKSEESFLGEFRVLA